jgi:hypothetical protein
MRPDQPVPLLTDRAFCSFSQLVLLAERGVQALSRVHQRTIVDVMRVPYGAIRASEDFEIQRFRKLPGWKVRMITNTVAWRASMRVMWRSRRESWRA